MKAFQNQNFMAFIIQTLWTKLGSLFCSYDEIDIKYLSQLKKLFFLKKIAFKIILKQKFPLHIVILHVVRVCHT